MTVYLVISLPKIPYIHRIYMVLASLTYLSNFVRDECVKVPERSCWKIDTLSIDVAFMSMRTNRMQS